MRFFRAYIIGVAICVLPLAGCRPEEEITKEEATHADREKLRLRVAIMERGKEVWFIRLSGPDALVAANDQVFESLVKSVKFDKDDEPTVEDPKGWKKDPAGPPGGLRFAGYRNGGKPKELEITITRMAADHFDLLNNVNRWQKQILVPTSEKAEDLREPAVTKGKIGDQAVTWIDLKDGMGIHTVSRPPQAHASSKKISPLIGIKGKGGAPGGGAGGGGGRTPFKFTVPEGWAKRPGNQIELEIFMIGEGKNAIKVSISTALGTVPENINRWRTQVGLEELAPQKAEASAVVQQVAGVKSYYVDLARPDGDRNDKRILGVVIPMGRDSWFVKMTGPAGAVGQHKQAFETFVKSFEKDAR